MTEDVNVPTRDALRVLIRSACDACFAKGEGLTPEAGRQFDEAEAAITAALDALYADRDALAARIARMETAWIRYLGGNPLRASEARAQDPEPTP